MTKRYYYTDPLAAAWMAKHHDFCMDQPLYYGCQNGEYYIALRPPASISYETRFYIHPDSTALLLPKNGDKVSYGFGVGPHAGEAWDEVKGVILPNDEGYPYTGNGEPYVLLDGGDAFPASRLKEIFQRNGIPFMWPESEEA